MFVKFSSFYFYCFKNPMDWEKIEKKDTNTLEYYYLEIDG